MATAMNFLVPLNAVAVNLNRRILCLLDRAPL